MPLRVKPLALLLLGFSIYYACSLQIQPNVFRFRGHPIAYERAALDKGVDKRMTEAPAVLLNGFGVGSFHQHRLMNELCKKEQHGRVFYGMDYLGQGKSWPDDCDDGEAPSERGLRYCGSLWVEQILEFIEQVVLANEQRHKKVHLVGNSLGGHLAVFCAAKRPDLVESVSLLNATPIWGLNLPGWSGHLPAPLLPKLSGRYLFDRIREVKTIRTFLENCYPVSGAFDDELMQHIQTSASSKGGHAAFASILWSPPVTVDLPGTFQNADFETCLRSLQCDVLLVFGSDDPWCKPAVARRMLRCLTMRPDQLGVQRYVELSRVGHCPNHEAPKAVSQLLTTWWDASDRASAVLVPSATVVHEAWGETVMQERSPEEIPLTMIERVAVELL